MQKQQSYPIKQKKQRRTQLCGVSGLLFTSFVAIFWLRALTVGHHAFNLLTVNELIQDSNIMDIYTRNLSVKVRRKTRARFGRSATVAAKGSKTTQAKRVRKATPAISAAAAAVAMVSSTPAPSVAAVLVPEATTTKVTAVSVERVVNVVRPPLSPAPTVAPIHQPVTPKPTPQPTPSPISQPATSAPIVSDVLPAVKQESPRETSTALPLVEFSDCRMLAPCHVKGDNTELKCATLYAQRFWKQAPAHLQQALQWQRDHRPLNCWYETELLSFARLQTPSKKPYPKAVCQGNAPDHVVYWHNFKVAGTTARHSLGTWGFPNYQPAKHIFSDELPNLVNVTHTLPGGLSEPTADINFSDFASYLDYVDQIKNETYLRQLETSQRNMGFTFVRSPVQRFLSGLEQVERLNDTYWEVSPDAAPCMSLTNASKKVECIVDSITKTRVFFNVHVYPQSYLFDTWTKQGAYDMAITVLDLKDMDPLFKRFKGKKIARLRESTIEGTKLNLKDKDLEPRLLVKICQLYEADLLLLQILDMEDPLCAAAMASPSVASS